MVQSWQPPEKILILASHGKQVLKTTTSVQILLVGNIYTNVGDMNNRGKCINDSNLVFTTKNIVVEAIYAQYGDRDL